jgi:hypothetical protein
MLSTLTPSSNVRKQRLKKQFFKSGALAYPQNEVF